MSGETPPARPSRPWQMGSALTMSTVGAISRGFLYGLNTTEVHGLDRFLGLLDQRADVGARQRGLVTVSNHVSVIDDPLIWGVLPLRYIWNPDHLRWGLGSYDLCFTNKALSTFFSLGQVLPTHRVHHSRFGGLFQPTMTQAIRLLSHSPHASPAGGGSPHPDASPSRPDVVDPFAEGQLTYSTNGTDVFPAPSAYLSRRHAWVHVFPEGMVHQQRDRTMRYFKWGAARLILESEPCPDVVPMWIEGPEQVMHETRGFPRSVPRPFQRISVTFGERLDVDRTFGDLRDRWRRLKADDEKRAGGPRLDMGVLTDRLQHADEAVALRKECIQRVRGAVLELRKQRGLADEDPKAGLAETYRVEGGRGEGRKQDGSIVRRE